ncbi:hypothetical protein OG711_21380 [Streptomyces uncialis]|uniref:hypothetical protein n=1 Tax=Streptomyces uncialis TaxID=1048205 RepID=UPI002E37A90E|nr:hypothetical protein [Streptomyces uncialis]
MTNQPDQPYGTDPGYPQSGYPEPYDEGPQTQQWQAPTWETELQPPITDSTPPPERYGAPQGYGPPPQEYGTGYGTPQHGTQQGQGTSPPYGTPQPYGNTGQYDQSGQYGSTGQYGQTGHPTGQYGQQQPQPYAAAQPQAPGPMTQQQYPAHTPVHTPPPAPAPAMDPPGFTGTGTVTGGASTTAAAEPQYATAADRARAEGRPQILEPGLQPAAVTAVLALLLSGAAALHEYATLVPLVLLQAVTAAGWFRLNGMWPARQGIALAFLGGLAANAALLVAGRENAPAAILGTLGVWVLLSIVLGLRSHAGPDERLAGLLATVVSSALAVIGAGYLGAATDAVVIAGIAVAAAVLARALPLPTAASVLVALLAAAGAGIAAGRFSDWGTDGALLGLAAGACALIGHRAASYDYPSRFVHMTAGVALPLAAAAPATYILAQILP